MIIGNLGCLKEGFFSESIEKALDFIIKTDFSSLKNGKYPIEGDRIFVNLFEYDTCPKKEKNAEAHKRYIDLHYVISGQEVIEVGNKDLNKNVTQEYNFLEDSELFGELTQFDSIVMTPGMFVIFYPSDIHRTGCNFKDKSKVRKVVIKIAIPSK